MPPPHNQTLEDVLAIAKDYDLVIMHTSTPSLENDVKCAAAIKKQNPDTQVGLIGAHVAVMPNETLEQNPIIGVWSSSLAPLSRYSSVI